MTHLALLRQSPLLSSLPDETLERLVEQATEHPLEAGTLVFEQGDAADGLYVLLEGTLSVYRSSQDEDDIELARVGPGSLVGEMAILDNKPRSASVRCVDDCRLLYLEQATFWDLLEGSGKGLRELAAELSRRLRHSDKRFHQEVLQRQMARMEAEIQRQRSLSTTVAGLAHEINTPVGIARSASESLSEIVDQLINDSDMPGGVQRLLTDISLAADLVNRNSARAANLVQQFKQLSAGQVQQNAVQVSLAEIVEESLGLYRIEAEQTQLVINFQTALTDSPWTGPPGLIGQILLSLLNNVQMHAYKDNGGIVEVLLERIDTGYRLAVSDHGKGISAADLERVFEPFFTTGREQGGTGLGLAIVRSLVEDALNGRVQITSDAQGTTVQIEFPEEVLATAPPAESGK